MMTTISTSHRSSSRSRPVEIRWSTRDDGDFNARRVDAHTLAARRRGLVDLPWVAADHVHGTEVVHVGRSVVCWTGDLATDEEVTGDGEIGDVAITDLDDVVLACWVADCAPVVLVGDTRFAVVHAGWRGLAAGVLDVAVRAFDEPVREAFLGPVIHPCCYEFGRGDLEAVARGVHAAPASISATTRDGNSALDVPAAVVAACAHHGIGVTSLAGCTGCDFDGFSHRVRRETERHVVAAWRPSGATP